MNLSRGILARLAVVLPPNHLENLHATLGSCGRRVVLEQFREYLFDRFRIFVAETRSLVQLGIHASVENIDTFIDSVLHAHGVGAALVTVAIAADALRDLGAGHFHGLETEGRLQRNRATDRNRDSRIAFIVAAFGLALFGQCEQLPKGPDIYPLRARQAYGFRRTKFLSEGLISAVPKAFRVILLAIIGLHEYLKVGILKPVTNLALEANVRDLPVAVVVGARPISIQKIAVWVGVLHAQHYCEIDLILNNAHSFSPSTADSSSSGVPLSGFPFGQIGRASCRER